MNTPQLLLAISTVFLVLAIGAAAGLSSWLIRGNMVSAAEWMITWIIAPAAFILFLIIILAIIIL